MGANDWSRSEVDAIVDDYLVMLALELAGQPYNKAEHRRSLRQWLVHRSGSSVEYKHANISAVLREAGFPYIRGYKPRSNYQDFLATVVATRLAGHPTLQQIAAADADRPVAAPDVRDILDVLGPPPKPLQPSKGAARSWMSSPPLTTNYVEREARNRALGLAGEEFVLRYERARLINEGQERLADRVEHTSCVRGDHEGYDILSFEAAGPERLIEVKTTKYGAYVPFFVTRNEVRVSESRAAQYHVYRLHSFESRPRLFVLPGAISQTCELTSASYVASPR